MRITSKGQVTVPKNIRDLLSIQPGDDIEFVYDGANVILVTQDDVARVEKQLARFDSALETWAGKGLSGLSAEQYMAVIRQDDIPDPIDNPNNHPPSVRKDDAA